MEFRRKQSRGLGVNTMPPLNMDLGETTAVKHGQRLYIFRLLIASLSALAYLSPSNCLNAYATHLGV